MQCCECFKFVNGLLTPPTDIAAERESFEQTVAFLASVPLFRNQLPRSELPKVAQYMTRKEWHRGQTLVRQGEKGRAFFLIQNGEALVMTQDKSKNEDVVRATLSAGDYFGGHTLTTDRQNVASIVAGKGLVTLSLSRSRFEELGLVRWLEFPKRQALHSADMIDVGSGLPGPIADKAEPISEDEAGFVISAINQNANLRAFLHVPQEKLDKLASKARRLAIPKGEAMAGDSLEGMSSFFIVKSGALEVVLQAGAVGEGQRSAEAAVASSTMAERFLRKQNILQELTQNNHQVVARASVCGPSDKRPRRAAEKAMAATASTSFAKHRKAAKDIDEDDEPAQKDTTMKTALGPGDSFGELAVLYNLTLRASFRAVEDTVIYQISRKQFAALYSHKGKRLDEYNKLLSEVHILSSLLNTERIELARNANGLVDFKPGERVLHQGVVRVSRQWYVIASGKAVVSIDKPGQGESGPTTTLLARLSRGGHFGERSLLRGEAAAPVSIDAGPDGMTCLTFDGELIKTLLKKVLHSDASLQPSLDGNIHSWWDRKAKGFTVEDSMSGSRSLQARLSRADSDIIHLEDLHKICVLGRGGYGQVSLVEHASKRRYALKTLSKGHISQAGAQALVNSERELMTMTNSQFVIKLIQTYKDEQHVYFLLEAVLGGSLVEVLRKHPEVLGADTPRGSAGAFYVACIVSAVEHLHERRIVHRDLKPENALLDERGYAKLCDMGFARFVLSKTNTLAGTPDYMAPEMIDFPHTHDLSVDWWALGVLTYELLAGQTPFEDEGVTDPRDRLLAIRRSQERNALSYPFTFPNVAKGFITTLLQQSPEKRLGGSRGAEEVRDHPMFRALKFDWEALRKQTLPSPFQKKWVDPEDGETVQHAPLGLDPKDSLYIPVSDDCDWDDNF
mmetsp:Transcript_15721/g.36898  ORF Transcript_15721/g.36898 Transcript_15721/m.36898 type:complete len:906 (-) Transcript_15721:53-2770(-)